MWDRTNHMINEGDRIIAIRGSQDHCHMRVTGSLPYEGHRIIAIRGSQDTKVRVLVERRHGGWRQGYTEHINTLNTALSVCIAWGVSFIPILYSLSYANPWDNIPRCLLSKLSKSASSTIRSPSMRCGALIHLKVSLMCSNGAPLNRMYETLSRACGPYP